MNKISIIIPVYNVEIYLEKCLNSVINQTLTDIEIICINDGSTDNSLDILKKYEKLDRRIILINQENQGVSVARNNGLKIATAPYIMFIDPDDWLEIDAATVMYNAITTNECDLVQAKTHVHYEELYHLKDNDESYFNSKPAGIYIFSSKDILQYPVPVWAKLWKKEIIDKHSINFPDGLYHQDHPFFWKYFIVSQKILVIENKTYNYLRRANSTISKAHKKNITIALDYIKICIDFYNYLQYWSLFNKYEEIFWIAFEDSFWASLYDLHLKNKHLSFDLAHSFIVDKDIEHLESKIDHSLYNLLINLKKKKYNKIYTIKSNNIIKKLISVFFKQKYKKSYRSISILSIHIYVRHNNNTKFLFFKTKGK
ncbi:MAG: glycosyltransferase [Alphaproteobacteria bacterium]|jgi:glycosyltransferase involved in cell wall biosynthesis|nr:glycosyltransferase [Alphaproteobacteria bacterium]